MKRRNIGLEIGAVLLLSGSLAGAQSAAPPVDQAYLQQQSNQLYSAIEQAVKSAGGDLNQQHLHLVFAFSTGHFAKDPLMAEAAREVASNVAAAHLVSGDQLSGYAWEMNVWPHKGSALNPLTVGVDRSAMRASFQDLWPRSPQAGSNGGHDTEAVISQLTDRLKGKQDAVIVLLTNSAASVAGTRDQRTLGENSAPYRAALANWTRVRTSNTTGASVQLGVMPDRPERTFDAVIVVPKAFNGAALGSNRTALLSEQVQAPVRSGLPWWLWVVAAAVLTALALLLIRMRNNRPAVTGSADSQSMGPPVRTPKGGSAWKLKVGDRSFQVNDVKPGEVLCVLCGPGYPVGSSAGQYVVLNAPELPSLKLLTVTREKQGLKLTPESDAALGGDLPAVLPLRNAEYRARLSGRASRQNLPPKPYQSEIVLTLES
ncbi:hypothetical protein FNU79_14020 [Deinococcus detaillensis]|uniref:VWA domain-containing protein n=1 Tax=Deinococcus detaillensis TaxID=2592048 RepID=A0A553UPM1_9DEIO|nr:hypothetical protein [Deinococcus detaillensis]TSA82132.1 hypothetical protein FNU79_14020 [Deinococcus detaillensis]